MANAPADLEIRPLRPGDDLDAQLDLSERAFGPGSAADRDRRVLSLSRLIAGGRYLGAFAGGRPAAGAAFQDMRQWWRGRPVPMAGVSSVKVAPEYRGRGIGRLLMTALLDEIAARGYPLSALFPATMPLYRSLGWELAGARDTAVIPARSLLRLVPPDARPPETLPPETLPPEVDAAPAADLRRAGPGDAEAVIAVLGRVHEAARDCGPITWDAAAVAEWLADPGLYAYLAEDGFLAYRWHNGNEGLFAERAEAMSARTVRTLWTQLGSHASIADKVYAITGPVSAFWWLTAERDAGIRHRSRWMLRVVDAPAAIAARGFPAATSLTVPLRIADDARPANSGHWQLTVAGGAGTLDPLRSDPLRSDPLRSDPLRPDLLRPAASASPAVTLGARGLAALYAGTPLVTLRQAGLAAGGTAADDAALDAAFAATPYMLDAF
jgi:GNAT superfamily N-acetyltransferase